MWLLLAFIATSYSIEIFVLAGFICGCIRDIENTRIEKTVKEKYGVNAKQILKSQDKIIFLIIVLIYIVLIISTLINFGSPHLRHIALLFNFWSSILYFFLIFSRSGNCSPVIRASKPAGRKFADSI